MKKVKQINIVNFAKKQAIVFGFLGLVLGVIYSFGGLLIDISVSLEILSSDQANTSGLSYGTLLAFGALFVIPLLSIIFGFITGIIEGIILYKYLYGRTKN